MNIGFSLAITVICLWYALSARPHNALIFVAFASFLGSYISNESLGRPLLPGPVVALAFVTRHWLLFFSKKTPSNLVFPGRYWLAAIFIYASFITITIPYIFAGSIDVVRPGLIAEEIRYAVPLEFSISNIAQLVYLFLAISLVYSAANESKKNSNFTKLFTEKIIQIAFFIGVLVLVDAVLNFVSGSFDLFGLLMGDGFGEFRPDRYALSGVFGLPLRRAQGIFGEPSFFSTYMLGALAASFIFARNSKLIKDKIKFLIILISLALSFSTTAYVGAGLVLIILALSPIEKNDGRKKGKGQLISAVAVIGFIGILSALILSSQELSSYIFEKLSDTDGYDSGNFSSGAERLYWDLTALHAFLNSFGLGVGMGSTRASSAFINILASLGIFGIALFSSLILSALKTIFFIENQPHATNRQALASTIFGWAIAFSISVPDINSFFYFAIGTGVFLGSKAIQGKMIIT